MSASAILGAQMSSQSNDEDIIGPYILWLDYGYEGWHPKSFDTIEEALKADKNNNDWIITERVNFRVIKI